MTMINNKDHNSNNQYFDNTTHSVWNEFNKMLFEKVQICLIFKRTVNVMTELYHSTPIQPSMNQYDKFMVRC